MPQTPLLMCRQRSVYTTGTCTLPLANQVYSSNLCAYPSLISLLSPSLSCPPPAHSHLVCPENHYGLPNSTMCSECPPNSRSPLAMGATSVSQCFCQPGYSGPSGAANCTGELHCSLKPQPSFSSGFRLHS